MENKRTLAERFFKKNLIGRCTERLKKMSLTDIMDALDSRETFDVLYFEHPDHLVPSKIFRISVGYNTLNTIGVIDIEKLRKCRPLFGDVSIKDLEATIDLDGTYLSKDDVLKMSDEMYIGQLEVIKDNLHNVEEFYDGTIIADGDDEIEGILGYLTDDSEIYTNVNYLHDSILASDNFVFVENVQVKLYLHRDIKFEE